MQGSHIVHPHGILRHHRLRQQAQLARTSYRTSDSQRGYDE
jgi:hypothetical protein